MLASSHYITRRCYVPATAVITPARLTAAAVDKYEATHGAPYKRLNALFNRKLTKHFTRLSVRHRGESKYISKPTWTQNELLACSNRPLPRVAGANHVPCSAPRRQLTHLVISKESLVGQAALSGPAAVGPCRKVVPGSYQPVEPSMQLMADGICAQ